MTREEKRNLRRRNAWQRLGFLSKLLLTILLLAIYAMGAVYVHGKQDAATAFVDSFTIPAPLPEFVCHHLLQCYLLAGGVAIVVLMVYPFHRKMVSDGCLRIALTNAACGLAILRGRSYVLPDDVKYLAPFVLSHRIIMKNRLGDKGRTPQQVIDEILKVIPVPKSR